MRLACILAIALVLNFPVAGMAREQEAPGSAKIAGQTPAPAAASSEKTTPETAPVAGQNASESLAKKKTDAGSASGTAKRRQRGAAPAPDGAPRKIVVRQGGASEPAALIAPDIPPAEAIRARQSAERLLGATGDQLKQLAGRTLDAPQLETVGQIRNYMNGARLALQEGDVRRASTLAQKAHLLSEDLVKH
jgi:hypothetical protein